MKLIESIKNFFKFKLTKTSEEKQLSKENSVELIKLFTDEEISQIENKKSTASLKKEIKNKKPIKKSSKKNTKSISKNKKTKNVIV